LRGIERSAANIVVCGFEFFSGHWVVFLRKTLYSDFLSPPRCIDKYRILFRIGEGEVSVEEEVWRHPHYAGPEKSRMLHISLTYVN